MLAKSIEIAEALKDELNGHSFSQAFAAERAYQAEYELPDMQTLHVTVVPKLITMTTVSRTDDQVDYAIDIGGEKKFGVNAAEESDALMALVEEIAVFLNRRPLAAAPDAVWVRTQNEVIFSPDHFQQLRQFTSVLTVTYRVLE